ncbi:MAG: pyruvate, phosphate dikinase [Chloroflexi bacterium]|nr:pyruvate, phosphate dikinase [Chloroflexota bacterium]
MSERKWVYLFNEVDQAEANSGGSWDKVRGLLGGKGANLADMTRIGVPVPPGFTVTTEACNVYSDTGKFPEGLWEQMLEALAVVEKQAGKKFGDRNNPLLLSCRSGAKFSMPGMMDTVLNIGLNDDTAAAMAELTGNKRFVYDSYRRLIHMFGSVVMEIPDEVFEEPLEAYKVNKDYKADTEMTAEDWEEIANQYKAAVKSYIKKDFPQDAYEQVKLATEAVFRSWNGKRAIDYRRAENISDSLGTAVNIQTMVFGNMGNDSGTGVAFTRNPLDGTNHIFGEYLLNAQGEDVVAGIRNAENLDTLKDVMPDIYNQFLDLTKKLEKHYKDMQDVEFTFERGKFWMLQTRNGKRTAKAEVAIAVQMVNEGLIDKKTAVKRVTPKQIDALLHPQFDQKVIAATKPFAQGVNASPGAAVGQIYFDADKVVEMKETYNTDCIMVRQFTKPDDVHGMLSAKGILTSEGGATSHAAVVARQFGVPCVVGASMISIDMEKKTLTVGDLVLNEGDWVSVDGSTGKAYAGKMNVVVPNIDEMEDLHTILTWADEIARMEVWTNADNPRDALRARSFGAKGIGLCRTEHMFFDPERLPIMQRMILAKNIEDRVEALNELLPFQRADFDGLFEAMTDLPVIIRLVDPPLHEFLPSADEIQEQIITKRIDKISDYVNGKLHDKELSELENMKKEVDKLHESNPMMGLRGIRLSIVMPEIVEMQVRAIFEAACDVKLRGFNPKPEIMIPLTGHVNELKKVQPRLVEIAKEVMSEKNVEVDYLFGTMIEIPRAAVTADEIAEVAQFFSFGTNDLTQMAFGYSRDDAERSFLVDYIDKGILPENPFQSIDRKGVGKLMKMAIDDGRAVNPDLAVGICGEHGGDPSSIEWCHIIGNDYVSCSPFRVPVARLAAAHAAIDND